MSLVIPDVAEVMILSSMLSQASGGLLDPLSLRLYSNNVTPAHGDNAATYTVVAGGGYANIALVKTNWAITPGSPSVALYSAYQSFNFTGTTNAPGTIYGYFILDGNGILVCAERFAVTPFTPINGSVVSIKPRLTCASVTND